MLTRSPNSVRPQLTFVAEPYNKRRKAAFEHARNRLRWLTVDISRLTGPRATDDPKAEYYDVVETMAGILNDPAVVDHLGGLAREREYFISVLRQGRPPLGKKRGRRANVLRDLWIAETVAMICKYHGFFPTRSPADYEFLPTPSPATDSKDSKECGCSIIAKVLTELGIRLSEKSVGRIFGKHWVKVKEPPGPGGAVKYIRR
jgi:hypothetical protein